MSYCCNQEIPVRSDQTNGPVVTWTEMSNPVWEQSLLKRSNGGDWKDFHSPKENKRGGRIAEIWSAVYQLLLLRFWKMPHLICAVQKKNFHSFVIWPLKVFFFFIIIILSCFYLVQLIPLFSNGIESLFLPMVFVLIFLLYIVDFKEGLV